MEPSTTFRDLEAPNNSRGSLPTIKIQHFPSPLGLINPRQTFSLLEARGKRASRRSSERVGSKIKSSEKKMLSYGSSSSDCVGIHSKEAGALRR